MKKSKEIQEGKVFAVIGIVFTIIGFLIVVIAKKDNEYAMFYAKQGLVLFIVEAIVFVGGSMIGIIPFIGWMISGLLSLGAFALWVVGIVYAASGEMKDIPLVGEFAKKIKL